MRALVYRALLFVAALAPACAQAGGDPRSERDAGEEGDGCGASICGARCVDLLSDPEHCGGCGRTCVVPHATAACALGACAVGTCTAGYADCDGDPDNGCERAAACATGEACTTSCGTMGTLACTSACDTTCAPPAETCNLEDDDCDGACESALPGCRVGVHRSNGPNGHFYTADRGEAACCSMTVEFHDFFFLSAIPADGTQPFLRCLAGDGHHLYTTDTACEGAAYEGQVGHILRAPRCGAVPLFRLRSAGGDHFYTHSEAERDYAISIGYTLVGTLGYVFLSP